MMRRVLTATIFCAVALAASASARQEKPKQEEKKRTSQTHIVDTREGETRLVIQDSDTGLRLDMNLKRVRFNDDYSDVAEVEPGGFLEIRETRAGETRRLDIEPDSQGRLRYLYRVRGDDRPFDDEGRAWLRRVMLERVEAGFDAENRAARLYRNGGARAVVEAARRLKSGYARAAYFRQLAKLDGPRDETAVEILRSAARDQFSDYERAGVLAAIAKRPPSGSQARESFFEGVRKIQSDYERSRVLMTLLKADDLNDEWALAAVRAVSASASDYEKARVLVAAVRAFGDRRKVVDAVLETSKGIASEYERKRVVTAAERSGRTATKEL